jgi:hypothetical protein
MANKALVHLESNINVLGSLRKFYADLKVGSFFYSPVISSIEIEERQKWRDSNTDLQGFLRQIQEVINDATLQTKRAKLLVWVTSNRKALVAEHLQAQATARGMELNESMFRFSAVAQRETIAMRVIAIVTLFYLPATFVSVCNLLRRCLGVADCIATDLFQHRCGQVSRGGRWRDVLKSRINAMDRDYLAPDFAHLAVRHHLL